MKCKVLFAVIVFQCGSLMAQAQQDSLLPIPHSRISIAGGLGVSLVNAADVVDYINGLQLQQGRLDDFTSAAEFFGLLEVTINESFGMKLEYSYLLKSYSLQQVYAPDAEFTCTIHMPTLIAQYLTVGPGYAFKFGGGIGYHIATFVENYTLSNKEYVSKGIGLKIEAEANTAFDDHLYACIAVDARKNIMGEFASSDGAMMYISTHSTNATMSLFSLGAKFGLEYYF